MEPLKNQSTDDRAPNVADQLLSYKKCLMYRVLMIIGDFGVNLMSPEESFRRWNKRTCKIAAPETTVQQ